MTLLTPGAQTITHNIVSRYATTERLDFCCWLFFTSFDYASTSRSSIGQRGPRVSISPLRDSISAEQNSLCLFGSTVATCLYHQTPNTGTDTLPTKATISTDEQPLYLLDGIVTKCSYHQTSEIHNGMPPTRAHITTNKVSQCPFENPYLVGIPTHRCSYHQKPRLKIDRLPLRVTGCSEGEYSCFLSTPNLLC